MITSFVLVILSAASGWFSYWLYRRQEAFAARAMLCDAEIIDHTEHYDMQEQRRSYAPVYRYTGADGQPVEARSRIFREQEQRPAPGARLRIRVDPERPQEAEAATFTALHWPGLAAGAFALFFLVAAVVTLP